MVILGLILVLLALALGAALVYGTQDPSVSSQDVDIQLFDAVTITLDPLLLVLAGMATMFLFWLGLVLIRSALARKQRLRRERKLQAQEARERQALQEREREEERERERLAAQERERDYERQLHDQRLSTEAARERAEVAESRSGTATRPIDTGGTGDDSVRERAREGRHLDRGDETQRIDPRDGRR